jgi:hypothetical protein
MKATETVSLMTVLALAACGSAESPAMAAVQIDTLASGVVRTISNAPVEAGRWQIVHERDVQPAEGEPGELLNPQDIALADDGTLYVVESEPAVIAVYGPDGQLLRNIGGAGAGPGEFTVGFIALRGDTLVLQDPGQARATVYQASTGEVLSIRPSPCCYWSSIGIDGSGRAYLRMMSPPDSTLGPTQSFLRFPIGASGGDTVLVPQASAAGDLPRWTVTSAGGARMFSTTVPFAPRAHEETDPTGGLIVAFGAEYQLRRTSNGLDTLALFGRTHPPAQVTDAMRNEAVEERVKAMQTPNALEGGMDEATLRRAFDPSLIPNTYPAFERIHLDRAGRVFVRHPGPDTLHVRFDLFSADNLWLDSLTVPDAGWAKSPYQAVAFSRTHIAVVGEDADGLPIVRIYRVNRGER